MWRHPSNLGGGLAAITLTFDNARVMYGFCSLKEPTAALPRYILINWVSRRVRLGEGRCVTLRQTHTHTHAHTHTCTHAPPPEGQSTFVM
ncbi:Drebrin [Liparis tanakae]|uniref:Drebrin n=1 Tax=Liparis tanakae TaxID=230148 RepID=A0A4Z2E6G4_9TELE|nr:Drebrin [Liparis tanakae]